MKTMVGCAALFVAVGCSKKEESKSEPEAPPRISISDMNDASECAQCHRAIFDEFAESMHNRSFHTRDPIYAGVRAIRVKKEGADVAKACARCHTPGFEANPDDPAAVRGVSCVACHTKLAGAPEGTFFARNDVAAGATHVHGTGPGAAVFKDGRGLCMSCHDSLSSPSGIAMCTTGPEHGELAGPDAKSCVDCHMPRTAGAATDGGKRADHASHAFLGPHRAWYQEDASFLETAVDMKARWEGALVKVELTNTTGHAFPTGFPGRMALVGCTGHDQSGAQVWQCEPRRLGKVYVDAEGKPTLAPFAAKLQSDTRIATGKTLAFDLEPPETVQTIEVTLTMRLLPPKLAKKLGLEGKLEAEPRRIESVKAER